MRIEMFNVYCNVAVLDASTAVDHKRGYVIQVRGGFFDQVWTVRDSLDFSGQRGGLGGPR